MFFFVLILFSLLDVLLEKYAGCRRYIPYILEDVMISIIDTPYGIKKSYKRTEKTASKTQERTIEKKIKQIELMVSVLMMLIISIVPP